MIMIVQKPTATRRYVERATPLRWKKPGLCEPPLRRRSRAAIRAKAAITRKGRKKRTYLLTGELPLGKCQRRLRCEADGRGLAGLGQRPRAAARGHHDLLLRRPFQEDVAEITLEGDIEDRALDRAVGRAGAKAEGFGPHEEDGPISRLQSPGVAAAQPAGRTL